jgi:atypical dual specificity phosphatase
MSARREPWSASEIRNFIYLGNADDSENLEGLNAHNITHILNVADDVDNSYPDVFSYCNLNVADCGTDIGISRVFDLALKFVQSAMTENPSNKILVHCAHGANRSATVVIALLMQLENLTLRDAWIHVRRRRRYACPLTDNQKELVKFELQLCKENTLEVGQFFTQEIMAITFA